MSDPEPFSISVPDQVLADLRERLGRTRWPELSGSHGWELGADVPYLRRLCEHWAARYDWRTTEARLNALPNYRWGGIHLWDVRGGGGGHPVMLIHGWPGAVLEFEALIPLLVEAGHDVVVPSLPGFGFSEAPEPPVGVVGVADRLRALMDALGHDTYAVQGGDWGAAIAARMAFDDPERVAGVHVNAVGVLPVPGDFSEPPMSDAEAEYASTGRRWRTREGFHLFVQGTAPDGLAVGLADSPAGLAAWLVEKYRRWSDCGGEVERRFSADQLCDYLTLYWATGTIGSSMRLYAAEARDRWRLAPGERISAPAAAADFPREIVRPPREWAERIFADLRSWTEMPRGGHFAAHEEPELLAEDVLGFLAGLEG
ncbi:MAG: epoxide hydrolase family protein [Solirubrobacterales bacterium]